MSKGVVNFRAVVVSEVMSLPVFRSAIGTWEPQQAEEVYVEMGSISANRLSELGNTSTDKVFEISLNNECAQKVRITFEGMIADTGSGAIATTNPTTGIQIRDESGNVFPINESREYTLYPGPNVIRFTSSLITLRTPVMTGPLGAVAIFTLAYR